MKKQIYWFAFINIIGSYLDALCFEKERWIGHLLL